MTISEIEAGLPWGLHDAYLERLEIDWPAAEVHLTLRLMITERQDEDRRGRIDVSGLAWCSMEPSREGPGPWPQGLRIGSGEGATGFQALPPVPTGCFLQWIFVEPWNSFMHICARDARLEWLEPAPVKGRNPSPALFPGDEIPDP